MISLTGLSQNEFFIVILNMVLWFFAEFLQYAIRLTIFVSCLNLKIDYIILYAYICIS
jgi:hypothetical protein